MSDGYPIGFVVLATILEHDADTGEFSRLCEIPARITGPCQRRTPDHLHNTDGSIETDVPPEAAHDNYGHQVELLDTDPYGAMPAGTRIMTHLSSLRPAHGETRTQALR